MQEKGGKKERNANPFLHTSQHAIILGGIIQMDCWTLFHTKIKASSWRDYPIQPQIQKSEPSNLLSYKFNLASEAIHWSPSACSP